MADLGLYFGEEDEEQLEQEEKALSYLVLSSEQDDAFDPVDTENLLAQMSAGSLISHGIGLDEDTDVVQLLTEPNLSSLEKAQLLSQSQYDHHRSTLARELVTLLEQSGPRQAISHLIPIIRDLSLDHTDSVREALASQVDKIALYYYCNAIIIDNTRKPLALDDFSEDFESNDSIINSDIPPPQLPHDALTSVFLNLLLDQNAGIAHQARLAIDVVSQNIPDEILESEILNGVIAGLEKLYTPDPKPDFEQGEYEGFNNGQEMYLDLSSRDEQDGEAELGKMLVVVLLTAMASLLGPQRCTEIFVPKLEVFTNNSQFYVRKEIVMALGTICKVVDQEVVIKRLLPMYDTFVQDDTWHIRRACCTVLAPFVNSLPTEMKASKVEEIYSAFSVDVSRSVRNSIMEVLGEVIAGFERGNVPDSLLEHFLDMGKQAASEHERAVMCAFSFPAVVLTAGPSKWEVMKPIYMRLAGTFRSPIRRSLACSLHEIAKILGPEIADRDLAIAFTDCLFAEDEVKEGVLGHVVEFISCLSAKARSDALHDLHRSWADLERSSNWRLRDSLVGQLPGLCEIAEGEDILRILLPLSIKACTDGVSTIRESGVLAFPALWEASSRVGSVAKPKTPYCSMPDLDFMPLSEEESDTAEEKSRNSTLTSEDQNQDVEMEDISKDYKNDESTESAKNTPLSTLEQSETNNEESEQLLFSSNLTTTIKEQVISQVADFAINGTFRPRVAATQIIQSLLDFGISTAEFEEHFLSLLVDHLAKDSVPNVRIWVARVINWIIESGYYGDAPDPLQLHKALQMLQQDPDRDVRIYSGGPLELPVKPKAKKSKKKRKSVKNDLNKQNGQTPLFTSTTISVFEQNIESIQGTELSQEEQNEQALRSLAGKMQEDSDDDNSDEDEDDDDDDDDDDDEEEEEKEEKEENHQNVLVDNSFVGNEEQQAINDMSNSEVVDIQDYKQSIETTVSDNFYEGIPLLEPAEQKMARQETAEQETAEQETADQFGNSQNEIDGETSEDIAIVSSTPPDEDYSNSNEAGEMEVEVNQENETEEMEVEVSQENETNEEKEEVSIPAVLWTTVIAESFSSPKGSVNTATLESGDQAVSEGKKEEKESRAGMDSGFIESVVSFPPLVPDSPVFVPVRATTPKAQSYAATVKKGDDPKVRLHLSNPYSMTSFTQVNIPEPPARSESIIDTTMSTESVTLGSADDQVLKAVNVKLSSVFGKQVSAISSGHATPSLSSGLSLSSVSSNSTSVSPLPVTSPLPFTYASVVASGAAAAARAFSPPISTPIATTTAALTC